MSRSPSEKIEHALETVVFASRWLLAPFYLGLAVSLVVLLIKFAAELLAHREPCIHLDRNQR